MERERRRAGIALIFSFLLAAYQMLGDRRPGNLDPAVWGFTSGTGPGFSTQLLGTTGKSPCSHLP